MILKIKATNPTDSPKDYFWSPTGLKNIGPGQSIELDLEDIPPASDFSRRQHLSECIGSGNILLGVITDLPTESPEKECKPVKKEPKVETTLKDVHKMMQKEGDPEESKLQARFNQGTIDDYKPKAISFDNNEGKAPQPKTVEIFRDAPAPTPRAADNRAVFSVTDDQNTMFEGPMARAARKAAAEKETLAATPEVSHEAAPKRTRKTRSDKKGT
jgi:hypothetical protein